MKTTVTLITGICLLLAGCEASSQKKEKTEKSSIHTHEKGKPEVRIKVNKRYDKDGNLISFDSTYSSYYEKRSGDKELMDSLVRIFKSPFTDKFPLMNDQYFKNLFFTDSLLANDFFHEDFFRKRFELNEEYMKKMMMQMDSVKNEFFKLRSQSSKN